MPPDNPNTKGITPRPNYSIPLFSSSSASFMSSPMSTSRAQQPPQQQQQPSSEHVPDEYSRLFPLNPPNDSSEFHFPFTPYPIQVEFMSNLYTAIEKGRVGIFESPTGTGKTLSILCGSLKWLKDNENRYEEALKCEAENTASTAQGTDQKGAVKEDDDDEPDWVREHHAKKAKDTHLERVRKWKEKKQSQANRLKKIKEKEDWALKNRGNKRSKTDPGGSNDAGEVQIDETYLLSDYESDAEEDGDKKQDKVKSALAALYDSDSSDSDSEAEEEFQEPQILFCSRTHSQLSQLVGELKKTVYGEELRVASLGSRKNLCVNTSVNKLKTLARINDKCLDFQKDKKNHCVYLNKESNQLEIFGDHVLAKPRDIEELVSLGQRIHTCPYYGTREASKSAQLITLPYNLLLQKSARESSGIRLKNNIIILDEAHNIIDTIGAIHTVQVDLYHIDRAHAQLSMYLERYKNRLKGKNISYIKQILMLLTAFSRCLKRAMVDVKGKSGASGNASTTTTNTNNTTAQQASVMKSVNDFVHELDVDYLNLLKIERYLEKSRVAQKLNGFVLKEEEKKAKRGSSSGVASTVDGNEKDDGEEETFRPKHVSSLQQVQAFFMSLMNSNVDGRVFVFGGDSPTTTMFKYLLLNPSNVFREIVEESRAVILAGGTMEPVSDFTDQLFPYLPRTRFHRFSCGHVVPRKSLLTLAVKSGPKGIDFEFKYDSRDNTLMMDELGQAVVNFVNIIPDGVVIFFASYSYLESVWKYWSSRGVLERILKKKWVFREPKSAADVDKTLREYGDAIKNCSGSSGSGGGKTGAMLFCVVGGKMSEGINFSDRLGRGVIMVGLPYPNLASPELKEKIKYVDLKSTNTTTTTKSTAGMHYYENLCMRAVNQSIGRAIRHQNDYATILLLDKRFAFSKRVQGKLPNWIGEGLVVPQAFGGVVKEVVGFFREKRGN